MNDGNVKLNSINTELLTTESEFARLLLSKHQHENQRVLRLTELEIMESVSGLHYGKDYSIINSLNPVINNLKRLKCITGFIHHIGDAFNTGILTTTIKPAKLEKYYGIIAEELSRRIAKPATEQFIIDDLNFKMTLNSGKSIILGFGKNSEERLFFMCLYNAWVDEKGLSSQEITDFIKSKDEKLPTNTLRTIKGNLVKKIKRLGYSEHIVLNDVTNDLYSLELKQ